MHNANSVATLLPRAMRGGPARRVSAEVLPLYPVQVERHQDRPSVAAGQVVAVRAERPAGPSRDALVDLVRSYVLAHLSRPIGVSEIVSVAGVSETMLRRAVHAETGAHLVQYMINTRLDRAHALLSTNRESRSVGALATALGFRSAAVFSRAYRKRFGEALSETRRRAVNNSHPSPDVSK